jgi:hypothetical protein
MRGGGGLRAANKRPTAIREELTDHRNALETGLTPDQDGRYCPTDEQLESGSQRSGRAAGG